MSLLSDYEQALSYAAGEVISEYQGGSLYEGYLEVKRAIALDCTR